MIRELQEKKEVKSAFLKLPLSLKGSLTPPPPEGYSFYLPELFEQSGTTFLLKNLVCAQFSGDRPFKQI